MPSKDDLRRDMRQKRAALSPDEVARASAAAASQVLALPAVQTANTVAVYSAIKNEIDPRPLADALNARVVYPRVVTDDAPLSFDSAPLDEIDVFVVPGLAFDAEGGRLGWGKGHYDRTLAAAPAHALRIGLAYSFQLVAAVPTTPADQPVDVICTDAGTTHVRRIP